MSMERLTGRKEDGHAYVIGCPEFEVPKEANTVLQSVADKCADLEDILGDTYDLDRLRELVEADKKGKCKIGRYLDCTHYEGLAVFELLGDCGGTNWICGWFEYRTSPALAKEDDHE